MYSEKFNEFYIALHKLSRWAEFAAAGVKWYWPYPITSFYELGMIMRLRPAYVMIGAPLSFDLEKVRLATQIGETGSQVPIRMVCNSAIPAYLPQIEELDGIRGQWVRPEDVHAYDPYIQCFEFETDNLTQEETMLHIYKENRTWLGNLNLIIKNLNYNVDNRVIPEELGERRTICGQRCWSTSSCHLCESALKFATALRKEHLKRVRESKIDNN
jgi:hypothetical protein